MPTQPGGKLSTTSAARWLLVQDITKQPDPTALRLFGKGNIPLDESVFRQVFEDSQGMPFLIRRPAFLQRWLALYPECLPGL